MLAREDVDGDRIAVIGVSQAGYWVPRALAFEHRLAAAVADGGVVDVARTGPEPRPPPPQAPRRGRPRRRRRRGGATVAGAAAAPAAVAAAPRRPRRLRRRDADRRAGRP